MTKGGSFVVVDSTTRCSEPLELDVLILEDTASPLRVEEARARLEVRALQTNPSQYLPEPFITLSSLHPAICGGSQAVEGGRRA